jgi:cation/acetate symporter
MATQTTSSADAFYKQLGRMYGTYTGGFIAFIVFLAILEWFGVPNKILGYFFVFFTLAVYAIIGVATRTAQVSEYYVAGRRVPAFYNGMATGADWMSAASFVGMAGSLFLLGYDGLAWVLGWTGGFVLVSILVGPYLRKFGAYTVPDFLSFRYGGNFARFLGVIVLVCCSFTYVTAQIYGTGLIASRFRRPGRHPAVRDAGRHAGGDLDADCSVYRPYRRLSGADRHPVDPTLRHPDPGADLRQGDRANRRA